MTLNYIRNEKTHSMSAEEIRARLGESATIEDATRFIEVWNTRFYDQDGTPEFYDDEDWDATWQECVEMLG